MERRTDREDLVLPERKIPQPQAHHSIARPRVQSPVHEAGTEGKPLRLVRDGLDARHGGDVVGQRLGNAPEHQADAHAGGEQHREPGERLDGGLLVVGTQADLSQRAEGEHQYKEHKEELRPQVEPGEVALERGHGGGGQRREGRAAEHTPQREGQRNHRGDDEHRIVLGDGAFIGLGRVAPVLRCHTEPLSCCIGRWDRLLGVAAPDEHQSGWQKYVPGRTDRAPAHRRLAVLAAVPWDAELPRTAPAPLASCSTPPLGRADALAAAS